MRATDHPRDNGSDNTPQFHRTGPEPALTIDHETPALAVPPADPEDRPPAFLGKYQILKKLGEGGQATVYLAFHPKLQRNVVIKWARRHLPAEQEQRLLHEGQLLAGMDLPGLVRVHDVDVHEGRLFLVFEHVAGLSLAERLRQERPAPRAAAALTASVAATLEQIHRKGVLHRDLKPANILIDEQGRSRLLDFGLACLGPLADDPAQSGITGSLPYMAPEQARGETDRIGPQADVFGLGAVLYQQLTGQPPYRGDDRAAVWEQARQGRIAPPRALNARVPRALERICLKALAPDLGWRYASAAALERALRAYLRRQVLFALTGGLVVAGLLVAALLLFGPRTPPKELPPPRQLMGELTVRVWSPDGANGKRGLRVDEPGALPVRKGDFVRLEARLNQEAYVYLLWLNSEGEVTPLYPWNRDEAKLDLTASPPAQRPLAVVVSPTSEKLNAPGWRVEGQGGLETALLLARRTPLPPEVRLERLIGKPRPARLRDLQEFALRGGDLGQEVGHLDLGEHRGLKKEAAEIDDDLLQLLGRLRPHFETVRAVRFAYQGEE